MTTKQLAFKSIPSLAVAEGATTPNLGVAAKGAWAWSSTLSKPVYWDGTKWTAGSSTGGGTGVDVSNSTTGPTATGASSLLFDDGGVGWITGTQSGNQAIVTFPDPRLSVRADIFSSVHPASLFFTGAGVYATKDTQDNVTVEVPRTYFGTDFYPLFPAQSVYFAGTGVSSTQDGNSNLTVIVNRTAFTSDTLELFYPPSIYITGPGVSTTKDTSGNMTVNISGGGGAPTIIEDFFDTSPKTTGKATPYGHYFRRFAYPGATVVDGFSAYLMPTLDFDIDDLEEFSIQAACVVADSIDLCISARGAIVGNFHAVITRNILLA